MTPADRLVEILEAEADRLGFPCPEDTRALARCPFTQCWATGEGAVSLTIQPWANYLNAGFPKGDLRGYREAHRLILSLAALYGTLTAVVHPRNVASARIVQRLGGVPIGLDPEGFIHYDIVHGRYTHAKPSPPT
jgi:hypothetical protein